MDWQACASNAIDLQWGQGEAKRSRNRMYKRLSRQRQAQDRPNASSSYSDPALPSTIPSTLEEIQAKIVCNERSSEPGAIDCSEPNDILGGFLETAVGGKADELLSTETQRPMPAQVDSYWQALEPFLADQYLFDDGKSRLSQSTPSQTNVTDFREGNERSCWDLDQGQFGASDTLDMLELSEHAGWQAGCQPSRRSALHMAVATSNVEVVQRLLLYGADVNTKDSKGRTPLHYAVVLSCKTMVSMLVSWHSNLESRDVAGKQALHMAVENGASEIVDILVGAGADINAQA